MFAERASAWAPRDLRRWRAWQGSVEAALEAGWSVDCVVDDALPAAELLGVKVLDGTTLDWRKKLTLPFIVGWRRVRSAHGCFSG